MKDFFVNLANGHIPDAPIPAFDPLKSLPSSSSKIKTIVQNPSSIFKPSPEKKTGYGSRAFNWVKNKMPRMPKMPESSSALNWIADTYVGKKCVNNSKQLRKAIKYGVISSTYRPFSKTNTFAGMATCSRDRLIEFEGNENLANAVDILVPRIAKEIKEGISGVNSPQAERKAKAAGKKNGKFPGFRVFLEKENEAFVEIIRGICYKVVANFAENSKKKLETKGEIGTEIVKELIKLAFEDFDQLDERFNEINALSCKETKKKLFEELFAPAAEKFLKIALPNGKADLELRGPLSNAVWKVISKEIIPEILVKSIQLVKTPSHHTKEDLEILNRPGGAALKRLAKFIAEQSNKIAPELLIEKSKDIAEAFMEKFTTGPDDHPKTMEWISQKIVEFASSKDSVVKDVWFVSGKNIESIVLHALASFCKDSRGNLIPDAANKALSILIKFIEENKEKIDKTYLESASLPQKKKQAVRAALFQPLVLKFLENAGLNDNELVSGVKNSALPAVFREFYQDMNLFNNNSNEFKERLINILFDEKAYVSGNSNSLKKDYAESLINPIESRKKANKKSGVTSVANDLAKVCGALAKDVSKIAREFAEEDREQIVDLINNGIFENYKLSDREKSQFSDGIHQLLNSGNKELEQVWSYSQDIIESVIFKVLVSVAENNPIEGKEGRTKNKNKLLASNIIHRLLTVLVDRIPSIDSELHEINMSDNDAKTKKEQIYSLFKPLAKDFLAMAGNNIGDVLPVPNFLKKPLKEKLENLFLPAIFYEVYSDLNGWRYEAPDTSSELENILESKNGTNAAVIIGNYLQEFVPYYMETNSDKVTNLMMQVGNRYTSLLSKENKEQIGNLIKKNIRILGTDTAVKETSKAIGKYANGMVLKMFTGIIRNIDGKEKAVDENGNKNNNFLLTTGISIIKAVTGHVKTINKIPKEGRNYSAHIVPHSKMLQGFADAKELHSALMKDLDPNATPEERKQQRLMSFYVPFAQNLLEISGMDNSDDFPVPGPMKKNMWKLFKEEILPNALLNIFEDALKPDNINQLVLSVLGKLADEVDDFSKRIDDADDTQVLDPHQRELDAGLGEFVKEMLDLVPEFWMKNIFKIDKIKKMTSEKLGQIVRKKLDDKTLIGYLNAVLGSFSLKSPDANRGKSESELQIEKQKNQKELHKKMTAYVSNQIKDTTKNFIKSKWVNFQKSFDGQVEKFLGNPGMVFKSFLDKIFNIIFIKGLGSIFNFLLFKCVWFFVDMKIASITKEGIKDAHMPIHENGVYKCCDTFIEIMKKKEIRKQTQKQINKNN